MAKDQGAIPTTLRPRSAKRPAAPPANAEPPKKPFNLAQFIREVRAETRKVAWTSWKETWITSVMVGIMVIATALFFFTVDGVFGMAMNFILKFGTQS